jgi:hypothetical protein
MSAAKYVRTVTLVCSLIVILRSVQGIARQNSDALKTVEAEFDN